MCLGSSQELPNASLLSGKDIIYIEPISKNGNDFIKPYFRKKEKAPEGAARAWIVSDDMTIDFVEGLLIRTDIVSRDPHPSSGLTGKIPVINLYLQDTVNKNLIYILESKMTALGRDIINTVLNFTQFEETLRIRLYSYTGGDRLRAGIVFETELEAEEPKAIEWKFDKSKHIKASPVKVGNRTEWDWSKVDDMLLHEFMEYGNLLTSTYHSDGEEPAPVSEEQSTDEPVVSSETSAAAATPSPAPNPATLPKEKEAAFSPETPATRQALIDYGVKVHIYDTPQEVEAFVDQFYRGEEGNGSEALRKKIFWKILNTNLPDVLDETTSNPDPCRVITYYAHSSLYNSEAPSKAVHMVAKNFKKFQKDRCQGQPITSCVQQFIGFQNKLIPNC